MGGMNSRTAQAQAKAAKRKALVKKVGTGLAIGGGVAGYLARENAIKEAEAKKQKDREKRMKQSPSGVEREDKQRYEKVVDRIKKGK
jgi:Na+/glutamate symporter